MSPPETLLNPNHSVVVALRWASARAGLREGCGAAVRYSVLLARSILCVPQRYSSNRSLKLADQQFAGLLVCCCRAPSFGDLEAHSQREAHNLPDEAGPADETSQMQKQPLQSGQVIFKGCLAGLGMAPTYPQPSCAESPRDVICLTT